MRLFPLFSDAQHRFEFRRIEYAVFPRAAYNTSGRACVLNGKRNASDVQRGVCVFDGHRAFIVFRCKSEREEIAVSPKGTKARGEMCKSEFCAIDRGAQPAHSLIAIQS